MTLLKAVTDYMNLTYSHVLQCVTIDGVWIGE
jgi:hypothetical protein